MCMCTYTYTHKHAGINNYITAVYMHSMYLYICMYVMDPSPLKSSTTVVHPAAAYPPPACCRWACPSASCGPSLPQDIGTPRTEGGGEGGEGPLRYFEIGHWFSIKSSRWNYIHTDTHTHTHIVQTWIHIHVPVYKQHVYTHTHV